MTSTPEHYPEPEAKLLTKKGLARRWVCSLRHLDYLAATGKLPRHLVIGQRVIRFRLEEVQRFEAELEAAAAERSPGGRRSA